MTMIAKVIRNKIMKIMHTKATVMGRYSGKSDTFVGRIPESGCVSDVWLDAIETKL